MTHLEETRQELQGQGKALSSGDQTIVLAILYLADIMSGAHGYASEPKVGEVRMMECKKCQRPTSHVYGVTVEASTKTLYGYTCTACDEKIGITSVAKAS